MLYNDSLIYNNIYYIQYIYKFSYIYSCPLDQPRFELWPFLLTCRFLSLNTFYSTIYPWLIDSADVEPWIWRANCKKVVCSGCL